MLKFRPRVPGLGPLDSEAIQRWVATPDEHLPGRALEREHRDRLGGLLLDMWTSMDLPPSYDEAEELVIEWRPEFRPAPTYEWDAVEPPTDLGWRLEWTRPKQDAEWALSHALDDWDDWFDWRAPSEVEASAEETIVYGGGCSAQIRSRSIVVDFDDYDCEDPDAFARAVSGVTGWAAAALSRRRNDESPPRFLAFEPVRCRSCETAFETDSYFDGRCPSCESENLTSTAPRLPRTEAEEAHQVARLLDLLVTMRWVELERPSDAVLLELRRASADATSARDLGSRLLALPEVTELYVDDATLAALLQKW